MLLIACPVCGVEGEEGDFHYGGQAHVRRPASHGDHVEDASQRDYLFLRHNPRGLHFERWRCDRGCGKWFHAARDTITLDFRATYLISEEPPAAVVREAKGFWAEQFSRPGAEDESAPTGPTGSTA